MKRSTIYITVAVFLFLGVFFAITPRLAFNRLQSAFEQKDTQKLEGMIDGAVLQFNVRKRIRERLYDRLLEQNGARLRDIDTSILETRASLFAEAMVQERLASSDIVFLLMDPMLEDSSLVSRLNTEQAYEILGRSTYWAQTRRQGSSKYVISLPLPPFEQPDRIIELWMIRYGMIWKITDVKAIDVSSSEN